MFLPKKGVKFCLVWLVLLICVYVNGFNVIRPSRQESLLEIEDVDNSLYDNETSAYVDLINETEFDTKCPVVPNLPVDIDVGGKFPELKFNATWITRKYFWLSDDFNFESRYESHFNDVQRQRKLVRVFVLPHSHNDPGWLNTYEQYYYRQTKHILDNAVQKLTELPRMTFVWSEITYLAKWWKEASTLEKDRFRKLVVDEGRLEIATGGWVVPDEATPSLYTLLSELTEGQQWVKNYLNMTSKYSWAIDPFGHSATHSHLLKQASMQGMVIQRLHYAWKHWLAEHKTEEFMWRPRWDPDGSQSIPCLTLPYDLYSIKHACGPEPLVCLKFDFRNIQFEYGENYGRMTPITKSNIRQSAQEIVAQYHKTASLTNHNVILVPLGDDFRYDRALEWDQQYSNYMRLFSYINANKGRFNMEIKFGTLRDYFETVDKLTTSHVSERPSLSGDFFPYGDVYVSGRPAYWTGFYGTRPYWKKFHRELENELRSAEILFTYANMLAKKLNSFVDNKILSYKYQDLITARQEFSVFAHHDGITGTSRTWTMDDYGDRLHEAYLKCISVQQQSLKIIYQRSPVRKILPAMLSKDFMRGKFELLPSKMPLEVFEETDEYATKIMIFNNLAWKRTELVKVLVKQLAVRVTDSKGAHIPSQINPVFIDDQQTNKILISDRIYELVFLANMEPLATSVFRIQGISSNERNRNMASTPAVVSCESCWNLNGSHFSEETIPDGYMTLENSKHQLYFRSNGLLERIHLRTENKSVSTELSIGMYRPTNKQSGAYLLKPEIVLEREFFQYVDYSKLQVIRLAGPIMSQIISIHYSRVETIKVNTTLINTTNIPEDSTAPQGVLLETYVDFSRDYSNRVEVYMRFNTGLNSALQVNKSIDNEHQNQDINQNRTTVEDLNEEEPKDDLVMYTDQNGLISEKRITIPSLEYEGNMYPVTTTAYIQDEQKKMRFSVLVDRTHGFCSMKKGRLETLIERKSLYDDGRGMSEGVTDSRPTMSTYVLLLENLLDAGSTNPENESESFSLWQPTLTAHKESLRQNYPPNMFVFNEPNEIRGLDDNYEGGSATLEEESTISLLSAPLPDNVHLLNLRTISIDTGDGNGEVASATALLNLRYLLDFKNDLREIRKCNSFENKSDEVLETRTDELTDMTATNGVNNVNNGTRLEEILLLVFPMNYANATRIAPTSLTGVVDGTNNLTEYGTIIGRNRTGFEKSLLVNFKLHFV